MAKKYETKLDELVDKLSTVSANFEKEKKANKTRIEEYVKTIQQKNEYLHKLEKNIKELNQSLSTKQGEYNELYFGYKERDKQLTQLKVELSNSCSQRAEKETVLSGKDTKILRLEHSLQKMYDDQVVMNNEKKVLNEKLLHSKEQIEKLNQKIQIINDQLLSSQHNTSAITTELAQSNERLKSENESLKRQNTEIRNVTNDMKQAITQLHELAAIDKQNNGVDLYEMQSLLDENEKLKKELHSIKDKLKEKERELSLLKREKARLHEISNRYHHELTLREFDPSPSDNVENIENMSDINVLNVDDRSRDELMVKIKELRSSLSSHHSHGGRGQNDSEKSLGKSSRASTVSRSADTNPLPSSKSIRYKYDEVRRKLKSGMNASRTGKSKHAAVRNWNHR